ncbi:hypothetical protein JYU34_012282 [Plutella xylostella]|uniref:Sulfotransferase domain-containing protein n=1 Tax=Plutella xylostella TaxID=51655 RepID=A0ABQ7QFI3_PLUXY|nr:hypothetical protein JYU34_012282 [Plutella xylostella]
MSRRSLFILAATIIILYFSVILFILTPLHGSRIGLYMESNRLYSALRHRLFMCRDLRWRSPPYSDPVALVSFPGSGNTWLRHLLQQSTGYLTGSVYNDVGLRRNGFPAENVTNGSVLVVKTHYMPNDISSYYKSAILLIRNPRDAILAEFNRRLQGHIGTVPKSAFKTTYGAGKISWRTFVLDQAAEWGNFHVRWLTQYPRPVHVVLYDELVDDTRSTLAGVLAFLNETVSESAMDCAMRNREGIFRRKKKLQNFDPFTEEMYAQLSIVRAEVMKLVSRYKDKDNHIT